MTKYDASSITWLKGAEAVRTNTALYLGATDTNAVVHLMKEVIGNSIDEASSGFGDTIAVNYSSKTGTVTVADSGRGIPVGKHPKHPDYDVLTILAVELHSGGKSKANNDGYSMGTIGTHGLGLAVVNALSKSMTIYTHRNNKWYTQSFKRGKPIEGKPSITKEIPTVPGHDGSSGTIIRFVPDLSCFDAGSKIDMSAIRAWMEDLAWFVSKNTMQRGKIASRKPVKFVISGDTMKAVIKSPGFDKYFDHVITAKKLEVIGTDKPFILQTDNVDVLLGWSSSDADLVRGYTNGAYNSNGGVHVKTFMDLVGRVFSKYAKKNQKYKVSDLLAGAVALINIRLKSPRFDSQSKTRLVSDEAKNLVTQSIEKDFMKWVKVNQTQIKEIIDRACAIAQATASMKNDRKLAAALKTKNKGKSVYPEGMLVSTTKDPMEREIYLVEGNSAAGSAVKASDRRYQEVLPLRGKIPNALRGDEKAYASKVILDILKAIGYTPSTGIDGLRVGKIVIMTDADPDGPLHGNTRVHTPDGLNPTIKEIFDRVNDGKDILVYGLNANKTVVEAKVTAVTSTNPMSCIRVVLEDGQVIRYSPDHRQAVAAGGNIVYLLAKDLTVGIRLPMVESTKTAWYGPVNKRSVAISTVEEIVLNDTFYCLTVSDTGNFFIGDDTTKRILTGNCHISSLLMGLFQTCLPELYEQGRLFIADTPLFIYNGTNGKKTYAASMEELSKKLNSKVDSSKVTRAKGLGEVDATVLHEVAFNPATRTFIAVTPEEVKRRLSKIMGNDVEYRKELLGL